MSVGGYVILGPILVYGSVFAGSGDGPLQKDKADHFYNYRTDFQKCAKMTQPGHALHNKKGNAVSLPLYNFFTRFLLT